MAKNGPQLSTMVGKSFFFHLRVIFSGKSCTKADLAQNLAKTSSSRNNYEDCKIKIKN